MVYHHKPVPSATSALAFQLNSRSYVATDYKSSWISKKRNKFIVLAIVLLVLIGAAAAAIFYFDVFQLNRKSEGNSASATAADPVVVEEVDLKYTEVNSSLINDGVLTVKQGDALKFSSSVSLREISLRGGELVIKPRSDNVQILVEKLDIQSGDFKILRGSRDSGVARLSVSGILNITQNSTFQITSNSTSSRNIFISAKYIIINRGEFNIEHYGNSLVQIKSNAISISSGNLTVFAPKYSNRVEFLLDGSADIGDTDLFTSEQLSLGFNFISATNYSLIKMQGRQVLNSFVKISKTVNIGDTWIQLDRSVENDWFVGDRIAIGPTGYMHDEAEEFRIAEISGNRIRLNIPANYSHYGDLQTFDATWKVFTLDERAEVALLTRNIQVNAISSDGGQIMATEMSVLHLQYIEIFQGGHDGKLRRYPIHFHEIRSTPGQLVRGVAISRSRNRCITVHASNYILLENNVCFDIKGHAYFLEDAIEIGNQFIGNLGMFIKRSDVIPTDQSPTTFWITNANNTFIGNVASGSENSCFWFLAAYIPLNGNRFLPINPLISPWGVFDDNVAHSCRFGIQSNFAIDPISGKFGGGAIEPRIGGTAQGERIIMQTNRLVLHHCTDIADWIRTSTFAEYMCVGCILADNRLGFRLAFHHTVKDSLIVGASANYKCSQDRIWLPDPNNDASQFQKCTSGQGLTVYEGHALYDGPNEIDRVHFAGFYGRLSNISSYAFMNMAAQLKSIATIARKISYGKEVPLEGRIDLNGSHIISLSSTQLIDEDGSITGQPNSYLIPEILTVSETPNFPSYLGSFFGQFAPRYRWDKLFNHPPAEASSSCIKLGTSKTYSCNEKLGLLKLIYTYSTEPRYVDYTRSDGLQISDPGYGAAMSIGVRLNRNISYGNQYAYGRPDWMRMRLMEVLPGESMIYRVDYISSNTNFTRRISQDTWEQVPSVPTINDLYSSASTAVYVDTAASSAWVKLVAEVNPSISSDYGQYRSKFKYNGVSEVCYEVASADYGKCHTNRFKPH